MLRDITIGQFYPAPSVIHDLDARLKITATFAYIISLFVTNTLWAYLFFAVVLGIIIGLSYVPPKFMFKGLKAIIVIIIVTAFLNVFAFRGGTVLAELGWFAVTTEGLLMAVKMCMRLVLLIVGASILTLTTSPIQLTDAIERMLRPFRRIGVPAHEIAMMMTIALRFIPTLLDETDKIMKAQQARGADFETGNFMQRAKSLIPILVPLFVSAFRRADELAMAMEARCYDGGEGRTRMKEMKLAGRDYSAIAFLVTYCVAVALLKIYLG